MEDMEAVLAANDTFYRAFADGDVEAMDALWADDAPVACIHPGWNALTEREAIMESWRAILESSGRPAIRRHGERVFLHGDSALVICYEIIPQGYLVATNVFLRGRAGWAMVHHHAGPTPTPAAEDDRDEPTPRLH